MRYIILHKTSAHWESGASPTAELVARVGGLIGELAAAKVFLGGEGLRASSQGARIRRADGKVSVTKGPFKGGRELAAGFSVVRAASLDEAVQWATKAAETLEVAEIDVRPLTEAWDIGMAPKPANVASRRYMALRKANEQETPPSPKQRAAFAELIQETARTGVHLATEAPAGGPPVQEHWRRSDVDRRPFSESKEMVGGYVIVSADSLEGAARWVPRYLEVVGAAEVDLLELEDAP